MLSVHPAAARLAPAGPTPAAPARVHLRPIRPGDMARLYRFGTGLSERTRYQRFFSLRGFLPGELRRLTHLDCRLERAVVATLRQGAEEMLVGVARYVADDNGTQAEIALVIADDWQRQGLGRRLLSHLIRHARRAGVLHLTGTLLATNHGMQRLALAFGFALARDAHDATILHMHKQLAFTH